MPFDMEAAKALAHYIHFARLKLLTGNGGSRPLGRARTDKEKGKEYLFLSKNGHRLNQQT